VCVSRHDFFGGVECVYVRERERERERIEREREGHRGGRGWEGLRVRERERVLLIHMYPPPHTHVSSSSYTFNMFSTNHFALMFSSLKMLPHVIFIDSMRRRIHVYEEDTRSCFAVWICFVMLYLFTKNKQNKKKGVICQCGCLKMLPHVICILLRMLYVFTMHSHWQISHVSALRESDIYYISIRQCILLLISQVFTV